MARNLLDLPPYIPLRGVNLDEDSLLIDQAMCVDIKNLRIEGHQLSQRPSIQQYGQDYEQKEDVGTLVGDSYNPPVTPIVLDAHSFGGDVGYNVDAGTVSIFWTDQAVTWTITDDGAGNLEDADSNVVGSINYVTGVAQIDAFPTSGLVQYAPTANTNCIIYMTARIDGASAYPFSSDRAILMKLFREPTQDTVQFYFLQNDIVKYNSTTQTFESILDPAVSFTGITHWSAVQFTDTNLGATMVACGTIPPTDAGGDETDGASREFLYYDKDAGTFKDLVQYQYLDEATGDTIEDGDDWTNPPNASKVLTAVSLPPVKSASAVIYWADDTYTWELTTNASDEVLDPDGNVVGSINLNTGVVTLDDMPERSSGAVTYTPSANNTPASIWVKYYGEINKKPRFVFNMNNRIVMAHIYNLEWNGSAWASGEYQPWRVRWTNQLDITAQEITSDYVDSVGGDISPYVAGEHIGDTLILYRINSIEQMFYVGGDNTFSFKTIQNVGIYAGQTVAKHERIHYFFGKNNVYAFDGNTTRPLGSRRVIKYIQDNTDETKITRFLGFVDPIEEQYWFLPVQTTDTNAPSQAFVYGIRTDSWTIYEFPKEITYVSFLTEYTSEPILATYDGYIAKITDTVKADQFMAYDATTGGHVLSDTAITGLLETRDFTVGDLADLDRILRMVFEAKAEQTSGDTVTVSHSKNYGESWSATTAVALTEDFDEREYWLDSVQKRLRFKFEFSNYFVLRYMYISGLRRDRDSKEEGA